MAEIAVDSVQHGIGFHLHQDAERFPVERFQKKAYPRYRLPAAARTRISERAVRSALAIWSKIFCEFVILLF